MESARAKIRYRFLVGINVRSARPVASSLGVAHTPDAHKGHHYISTSPSTPPLSVSPGGDGGGWANPNVVMPLVGIKYASSGLLPGFPASVDVYYRPAIGSCMPSMM